MLIGLTGKKQSGKDTFYKLLLADQELEVERVAFADPIREALYTLNPFVEYTEGFFEGAFLIDLVDNLGWEKAKQIPDVRRLMQRFGTEVGRQLLSEDVWVNLADPKMRYHHSKIVCVTDCRFPEEIERIRKLGGVIVNVVRPEVLVNFNDSHESETHELPYDYQIVNDGTLEDFTEEVWATYRTILAYQ